MGSFEERKKTTEAFISIFEKHFWNKEEIKNKFLHVSIGYENFIPQEVQQILKRLHYNNTAQFIRFLPDNLVVSKRGDIVLLFEYKVSKTPRYSEHENQWFIAQLEAAPFENYLNLVKKLNVKVAICLFVPYNETPIYIDWVENFEKNLYRPPVKPKHSLGSGTPYVNIDVRNLTIFVKFLKEELKIKKSILEQCFSKSFWDELQNNPNLQVNHHQNSPYKNYRIEWDIDKIWASLE